MIDNKDLIYLYDWAKITNFPLKKAPTSNGYSNKPISYCWLKKNMKTITLRKSIIQNKNVEDILENDDILFCTIASFESNTILGPHKDPNVYRHPYKRIQIPLDIPDKNKCYMIWKGEKVFWEEGKSQIFDVMNYVHEGYNYSESPMVFLFVDVKKESKVDINSNCCL
jgi:hypothetical protein